MDFRIITVDEHLILLDRLQDHEATRPDTVMVSTYVEPDYRYDENYDFENPDSARAFVRDFSQASGDEFLMRAEAALERADPESEKTA